jgi:hypothetical protein
MISMVRERAVEEQPEPHRRRQHGFGDFENGGYVRGEAWETILDEEDE